MLSVSPHFRANHPAFAAHRAPPPTAAADDDDADYVLALAPEWAAKLKPTIERLRARDGGGRKKQPRRKKAKNKRPAPAPAPAADLEALAAAAQEYAAARDSSAGDAEPQARTISAPPDESAAEPTLQESLETRRDQLLAWLSLS